MHTLSGTLLCVTYCFTVLIQEPQHPEGKFGTVGHIPVVGEYVGILYAGNLREVLAATANLEGVFPINLEVSLCLAILNVVRLRKTAYGKGLAQGADVTRGPSPTCFGISPIHSMPLCFISLLIVSVLLLNYHSTNLSFGKTQTSLVLLSLNRFVHNNMNNRFLS